MLHKPAVAGVLFDLDGTLVDSVRDIAAAIAGMCCDLRMPAPAPDAIGRWVGKGAPHLVRTVLEHASALDASTEETVCAQALARYQHHYDIHNGRLSLLYPQVEAGLRALREMGLPMACVTNKPEASARALLAHHGLLAYFQDVVGGDRCAEKKPHPAPLLHAARALGLAPERVLMVGDSSNDALAARRAGCAVWLVPYGYNHGLPVQSVDCDGIVDDVLQVAHRLGGR